jgi:xanthine/uracil permease
MADTMDPRSLPQLVGDLTHDLSTLVRKESELIRVELKENMQQMARGGATLAVGAVLTLAAAMILLQTLVLALAKVMDPVWASLLVGVVVAIVGVVLLRGGAKAAQPSNLRPDRAANQLRKDAQLVKEQVR